MGVLVAATTLWCLFGLVLFLPLVGAPPPFRHAAGLLLALQFVVLTASTSSHRFYVLATQDMPLLGVVLAATAVAHALRASRS